MSDEGKTYLTTVPATMLSFEARQRRRPCWRCRFRRERSRHWQCRRPPLITYVDGK